MTTTAIDTSINPSVSLEAKPTPLYSVERFPLGFRLFRKDGLLDLTIKLNEFTVEVYQTKDLSEQFAIPHRIYIYNYHKLLKQCAGILAYAMQKKHEDKKIQLTKWLTQKVSSSLSYSLFPEWQHLLGQLPNDERLFLKLACSKLGPKFEVKPELLRSAKECPFLWKDLHQYNSPWLVLTRLITKQRVLGNEIVYNEYLQADENIGRCATPNDWRQAFSGGKPYKALNKTLDAWPRGISWKYADQLNEVVLPEPITERVKLIVLLATLAICQYKQNKNAVPVVLRSSPEQIRRAFRKFKKYYEKYVQKGKAPHLSLRGCKTVNTFVNYIADYPDGHEGEIAGLTEKAIVWHRQEETRREAERLLREAEYAAGEPARNAAAEARRLQRNIEQAELMAKPTRLPPVDLPAIEGIRFLDTAKAIIDEGDSMKHCIANYAPYAVKGERFLFHCDYEGEMASVSVLPTGKIEQCYGPRNCTNKASAYAEKELERWLRETKNQWAQAAGL